VNEHGHLALPLRELYEAQLIREGWVKSGPNCWSRVLGESGESPTINIGSLERITVTRIESRKSMITRIINAMRRWVHGK
jgi:hypothetical protein